MADIAKRLYGPALLSSSVTTLYTVPASTTTILRYIRVSNSSGTDRSITLSVGADGAGTRIFAGVMVPNSGGYLDWSGFIPLAAGEVIQASSQSSALVVVVSGVEVT